MRAYILPSTRPLAGRVALSERLAAFGLEVLALEAPEEVFAADRDLAPAYPLPLNAGDLNAWRSHRAAWREIAASESVGALVMTDGVTLAPEFAETLAILREHASAQHYIRFPALPTGESQAAIRAVSGSVALYRPEVIGHGVAAQFVGREAAARLLSQTASPDRPLAAYLQMPWEHGVEVLSLAPSGVSAPPAKRRGCLTERLGLSIYHARIARRARLFSPK